MGVQSKNEEQSKPSLLTKRWKDIKTSIYHLAEGHNKYELVLALLRLREEYTSAPTLSEITRFTGFDVAIHTLMNWEWDTTKETNNLQVDATEIGNYGAELTALHTLRECINNDLLRWNGEELIETKEGETHFEKLNSFNVDITGSRMDIARKRFTQGRLSKKQRKMDPVNKIPSVRRLYFENSILMLLRAPLPFYQAKYELTKNEQQELVNLHSKMVEKSEQSTAGVVRFRLTKGSNAASLIDKLTPQKDDNDRRPRFVTCIKDWEQEDPDQVDYHVGLGSLAMFTMFLMGFERDQLDEKAYRAEDAVCDIIEHSGYWKVIDSNAEVVKKRGDVITEIDVIARSIIDEEKWLTIEVKDFSFWKGWTFGQGAEQRKEHYLSAASKLPVKEEYIRENYECEEIKSVIVTSIPEPFDNIHGIPLVYMSDLSEELARRSNVNYSPRKRHVGSNFLIRYFERLQSDYEKVNELDEMINKLEKQKTTLKKELAEIKEEYEKTRETYKSIKSEYDTLKVSEKLASKRLLMDTGEKHYELEKELKKIRKKISKVKRERKLRANILHNLKDDYNNKIEEVKNKDKEIEKVEKSKERYMSPRLF